MAYTAARAIRAFVKWYADEYKDVDWSSDVPWCEEKDVKPQPTASRNDVAKILATCDESFVGRRDFAILTIFGATSLRRGELARMQWYDIDFNAWTVSIPRTKTRKYRDVHLSRDATRALRRYETALADFLNRTDRLPEKTPWVWTSRGSRWEPLTPDAITKLVVKRAKDAGVDVTPQSFRRGYAMHFLRQGGPTSSKQPIALSNRPPQPGLETNSPSLQQTAPAGVGNQ